ncbi:hypothetical protein MA16_Dca017433 [Dendrobium catenatum]|uniref:Uncharacterized protein n=1 Tax=Dendrobium catenatum TaxID=906689 RepID=A0A2I0WZH5_9ASPA|nr:hypothetical protein MA16_Dca017433 [Dendrobium catenatum]
MANCSPLDVGTGGRPEVRLRAEFRKLSRALSQTGERINLGPQRESLGGRRSSGKKSRAIEDASGSLGSLSLFGHLSRAWTTEIELEGARIDASWKMVTS